MNNKNLTSLFLVVLLDMIGVGIIIPLITPLFQDTNIFFSTSILSVRNIWLGLLLASYPLAQFFAAPILGDLSDKFGRKPLLMFSMVGTLISRILFVVSIQTGLLPLLFFSRVLDGITGGNVSVALASIADFSKPEEKAKNFGMVFMAFGVGFIIGPVVGGVLGAYSIFGMLPQSTPLLLSTVLSVIVLGFLEFNYEETLVNKIREKSLDLLGSVKNVIKAFTKGELVSLFLVSFFFTFGFNFFTSFIQNFLVIDMKFSLTQIGYFFGYVGIWIAFTQGFLTGKLAQFYKSSTIISVGLIALVIGLLTQVFAKFVPQPYSIILLLLPLVAISNGLVSPNLTAEISNNGSKEEQGELVGISTSVQSLAMAIPPIIAGFASNIFTSLPILIGAFFVAVAFVIYFYYCKK